MTRWTSLLQTSLLLGGMMALVAIVGTLVAGGVGLVLALGLGVALAGFGQAPPRLVLFLQGARPLPPFQAPGLHRVMEELARRAGLPRTPQLHVLPSRELNAFTVGSAGTGAAVALSEGLLRSLAPRELVGVVAHEVGHIRNGDTTVLSLATVVTRLTSAFATVGQLLLIMNIPMMMAGYAPVSWWLVLVLLGAPTVSALLLLGLSRTREFQADREAARLTGDPEGLASALARMEARRRGLLRRVLTPGGGEASTLWQTHPPTEARIRRLLDGPGPDARPSPPPGPVPRPGAAPSGAPYPGLPSRMAGLATESGMLHGPPGRSFTEWSRLRSPRMERRPWWTTNRNASPW